MALIGVDTGLFAALTAEPRSFTNSELAEKTGKNLSLIRMPAVSSPSTRDVDDSQSDYCAITKPSILYLKMRMVATSQLMSLAL